MVKYKYRFKIRQEFLNEYGPNWRILNSCGFSSCMDYLFGTELKLEYYEDFLYNGKLNLNLPLYIRIPYGRTSHLGIRSYMLKEIRVGVDYNKKRKLVYD